MTTSAVHRFDVFSQAEQTAHDWLGTVARHLATEDPHHAYRIVRAWLHTVRDRLTVEVTAHFAAQLPLLWRGLYYDGWRPQQVPVKYDADQFLITVAEDAGISLDQARHAASAVTAALVELTSADQIGHLLTALPRNLRQALDPATAPHQPAEQIPSSAPPPPLAATTQAAEPPLGTRVELVERDVQIMADALSALLQALDERPSSEPAPERSASGARRAHQILLTRQAPS